MESNEKEKAMRNVAYAVVAATCLLMPSLTAAQDQVPVDAMIADSPVLKGWSVENDVASSLRLEGNMATILGDDLPKIMGPERYEGCTVICVEYGGVDGEMEYWIICPGIAGN